MFEISTSKPCSSSQGAKMSTHCLGSWPSHPPQTNRAFFFFAGACPAMARHKIENIKTAPKITGILCDYHALVFSSIPPALSLTARTAYNSLIQMFRKRTGQPWSWRPTGSLSAWAT